MRYLRIIISAIKNYRFNSIFIHNLVWITVLILIPLLFVSLFAYQQMNQTVKSEIQTLAANNLEKTAENVANFIVDTNRLTTQLSLNEDIKHMLYADKISANVLNNSYNLIKMYTMTSQSIHSIYIYSEYHQQVLTNHHYMSSVDFNDTNWLDVYHELNSAETTIYPRKQNNQYPYYLTFIRPVFLNENNKVGAVVINVNIESFENIVGNIDNDKQKTYLLNDEDTIIFSQNLKDFNQNIFGLEPLIKQTEKQKKAQSEYISTDALIEALDWRLLTYIPLDIHQTQLNQLKPFLYLFFTISFLVAILLAFIIALYSYNPVNRLVTSFSKGTKDDLAKYRNEINYIESQISATQVTTENLTEKSEQRLRLLQEAQTAALQAQTNPHFLSNTLETMKWMAMKFTNGENDLSKMTDSLSDLLRLTLGSENSIISIEEEVKIAQKYVEIMKIRYSTRFNVLWQVDSELLQYKTIQLSLQPLIENAIYHGFRELEDREGKIVVTISSYKRYIHFEVRDNGLGITAIQLEKLHHKLKESYILEGKHVGVRNINDRLKLVFGKEYQLNIESKKNKGTTISFYIPMIN